MSDDMSAYRDVFMSESAEYLQTITDGLLALEADPNDLEPVEAVFRGAHSLKGMAAAMGYDRTTELTHTMESLMETVRQQVQPADSGLIDLMLRATDTVHDLIADESEGGGQVDASDMIAQLRARTAAGAPGATTPAGPPAVPVPVAPAPAPAVSVSAAPHGETLFRVRIVLEEGCVLKSVRAYMVIKRLGHMGTVVETHPDARAIEDERFDDAFEVDLRTAEPAGAVVKAALAISEVASATAVPLAAPVVPPTAPTPGASPAERHLSVPKLGETQTVRVSIGHLDDMVNLVGELVIVRSRLDRVARDLDSAELRETLDALEQVSTELQHEVMETRMVPVGNIFNRFPRMVRDLSHDLGRDVTFEMEGLDIELDRTVLDEIGDPIVHLLRNAIDHGVEPPADRLAAGKPERGVVRLLAQRERDQVLIVVSDDGRGMDVERIWKKAVQRGLVDADARDDYSDQGILLFTCAPGFSTTEHATKVSGRGVGMDVVKGKIEYLGGTLAIRSTPGRGSEMVLSLPLTLAIIQALLVAAGDQVFAMPISMVTEVVSPQDARVESVDGSPVMIGRDGEAIPLAALDELVGATPRVGRMPHPDEHIALVETPAGARALAVEALVGRQEVVVKPLSPLFKELKGLAGATVLGDGRVALILDPRTLFSMGG